MRTIRNVKAQLAERKTAAGARGTALTRLSQTLETQLTDDVVFVIAIGLPGSEDQPVVEPVPEKHASQRSDEHSDTRQAIPFNKPERGANRTQKVNIH